MTKLCDKDCEFCSVHQDWHFVFLLLQKPAIIVKIFLLGFWSFDDVDGVDDMNDTNNTAWWHIWRTTENIPWSDTKEIFSITTSDIADCSLCAHVVDLEVMERLLSFKLLFRVAVFLFRPMIVYQ